MILFFFSSRRRHTRFKCDWSSDVCSSDLGRYRRTRLAKDPLPAPVWLPRELVTSAGPSVFVLPDRIAVMRPSSTSCAIDLEIRAPSGELCGSQTLHVSTVGGGVCLQGFAVVGQDGTLLVRDYSQKALQVWPRLFAPR